MEFTMRQVEQSELSRPDVQSMAYLPYRYTAHLVAKNYMRHWATAALAVTAFAVALLASGSAVLATAALTSVPVWVYAHTRLFDWLVIERRLPEYRDFVAAWSLPHRIYVAECVDTKEIIGLVCLQHGQDGVCDLQHAAVKASRRRGGVGASLVRHFIAEASRLGYDRITLYTTTVQVPAVALYKRLGFSVDRMHDQGVYKRIPLLPKPFAYVHMSLRLGPVTPEPATGACDP